MKNFKLLLATTAILSVNAINANAASNDATLEMRVGILKPIQAISEEYLGFGQILAESLGENEIKQVVVTPAGLDTGNTTATMLSTASFSNYAHDNNGNIIYRTTGSVNPGKIRYKNILNDSALLADGVPTLTSELADQVFKLNFPADPVELTDANTGRTCGTVSGFSKQFSVDGKDLVAKIGGTFKMGDLGDASNSLICSGTTTVTFVYNTSALAQFTEEIVASKEAAANP